MHVGIDEWPKDQQPLYKIHTFDLFYASPLMQRLETSFLHSLGKRKRVSLKKTCSCSKRVCSVILYSCPLSCPGHWPPGLEAVTILSIATKSKLIWSVYIHQSSHPSSWLTAPHYRGRLGKRVVIIASGSYFFNRLATERRKRHSDVARIEPRPFTKTKANQDPASNWWVTKATRQSNQHVSIS